MAENSIPSPLPVTFCGICQDPHSIVVKVAALPLDMVGTLCNVAGTGVERICQLCLARLCPKNVPAPDAKPQQWMEKRTAMWHAANDPDADGSAHRYTNKHEKKTGDGIWRFPCAGIVEDVESGIEKKSPPSAQPTVVLG